MTKRQLTVKVSSMKETLERFKDVWEQAKHGKKIEGAPLEAVSFENAKLLIKTLSPKRLELLQQLHAMGKTSIRALTKKLTRDYSNVHEDVKVLHHVGLILRDSTGNYYMPWDKIVTEIPMDPIPTQEKVQYHKSSATSHVAHR
jgi:predicted transcriptional regulator